MIPEKYLSDENDKGRLLTELEPVRQSGSGPAGPDKTGRKVHPAGRNRIFAGFFAGFLPDFCWIDVKNDPAGFRPDRTGQILKLAGPDRTGCKKSVRFQLCLLI
jgi:hypothetical protein